MPDEQQPRRDPYEGRKAVLRDWFERETHLELDAPPRDADGNVAKVAVWRGRAYVCQFNEAGLMALMGREPEPLRYLCEGPAVVLPD